ncbi:hypothetical protein [Mycolicibacterium fortuitum]|uniref:hypothetical protein n=2 Tax=Mycolicibacterium TaxID=1866885 RepID=UPI000AFD0DD2|nr:hypothetical protein [Mycolicibacterium fortuitum]
MKLSDPILRSQRRAASTVLALGLAALSCAPHSTADTSTLRSAVDGARPPCPAFESDPILDGVASRANTETRAFKEHRARFVPFEDPMPVLQTLGYPAGKAKLIPGYGDTEEKAVRGVMVHGWEAIPDCTYTKYGVNVLPGDGYVLTALILVGE